MSRELMSKDTKQPNVGGKKAQYKDKIILS